MAINKIGNKAIDSTLITGNTLVTAASGDTVLISDASDSGNLKKAAVTQLGNTVDSTFITANTTVTAASDDSILISDTSDSGNLKKALISTITDTMIANGGNNRILTDTATAGSVNGEANLTFDGSTLALTGNQTASGTITAAGFTIGSAAITETELEILDGATISTAELNSLASIGSDTVATQLATKAPLASPALTGTATAVNLTLSGNLTVNGTSTTVSSTNTTVTDNIIELNSGASSNANDSGILIERGSTGDNAFMGFDESSDTFVLGTTTATADATGNLTVTPSKITVGGIVIGSADINETELEILDGATLSTTELNYVDGVTSAIQTQIDSKLATAGGTMTGDLVLGDGVRLELGSESDGDLAIYHDGTHSYIDERGTGNLYIKGTVVSLQGANAEQMISANQDGGVEMYFNNSRKFDTVTGGVSITGTTTSSGNVVGDGIVHKTGGTEIGRLTSSGNNFYIQSSVQDGDILIRGNDGGTAITALSFDISAEGAATFNSTVTATTFSGSGASLTNLPAANITGTLPAIDGSNLTGIETVPSSTDAVGGIRDFAIYFKNSGSHNSGHTVSVGDTVTPSSYDVSNMYLGIPEVVTAAGTAGNVSTTVSMFHGFRGSTNITGKTRATQTGTWRCIKTAFYASGSTSGQSGVTYTLSIAGTFQRIS
jgi:hypothetical protein